jgi:sigma-E factor negative regulatory protein RseC
MIEETGRVVAIEEGAVWVETLRKSTCSSCSANAGCGQGLMDKIGVGRQRGFVRVLSDLQLALNDVVIIGISEDLLLRSAVLVYLLPLLGLLAGALLASSLALTEGLVILSALASLLVSWLAVRWYCRRTENDPARQPVVLRAMLAGATGQS